MTTVSCSWCHFHNDRLAIFCAKCGHQNCARMDCKCPRCDPLLRRVRDLVLVAEGSRREPMEAWEMHALLREHGINPDEPRVWSHAQRAQTDASGLRRAEREVLRDHPRGLE